MINNITSIYKFKLWSRGVLIHTVKPTFQLHLFGVIFQEVAP